MRSAGLVTLAVSGIASAQETVLGVYIFSRHGDRTAKSTPPANLTDLGYQQVFMSGNYFRNRYVSSNATARIYGLNPDLVKQSQIAASAPADTVLQNSAQGFLQGLYPPVGPNLGANTLKNGTTIVTPLDGYQLIPVNMVESGSNSEDSSWLQGSTDCANAEESSKEYKQSREFKDKLNGSQGLYNNIQQYVNNTFNQSSTNFANAYTIWDLLNVASIHNDTAPLPDTADFRQLKLLADDHEFNSAYNASSPIRAIAGSTLAAQVVEALNQTITSKGKTKFNVQFGAYGTMFSYFGLSNLISKSQEFYGVADYASTLTWEVVTNATVSNDQWPSPSDIYVRFLFKNGTILAGTEPTEYPLFGSNTSPMPWQDFVGGMNSFAIGDQQSWCQACGNTTGVCAPASLDASSSTSSKMTGGGISKAVAGVIGAMVTLAVIIGAQVLIMLLAGLRITKRRNAQQQHHPSPGSSISGSEPIKAHG